jgi:hypothetical protein
MKWLTSCYRDTCNALSGSSNMARIAISTRTRFSSCATMTTGKNSHDKKHNDNKK